MIMRFLALFCMALLMVNPVCANAPVPPTGNATTGNVTINDFTATKVKGDAPLQTTFKSNVSGNVTGWCWIFEPVCGDYYSQHPGSAVHTYRTPGVYNVTLEVWDKNGQVASLTKEAFINVTKKASSGSVGSTPNNNSVTPTQPGYLRNWVVKGCTNVHAYIWDFGDGSTVITESNTVSHVYEKKGQYPIKLIIQYESGQSKKVNYCMTV